jgi:[ribosomal protein S18]-alanine N-acetyltransferase
MHGRKRTMSSHLKPIKRPAACITKATAADAGALAALCAEALPPGWPADELAKACSDPSRAVLKATEGSYLHGFLILQFAADEAEILAIATAKDWRRRGFAASLLRRGISVCQDRIMSCIYLEVAESNTPARRLYEKFGFLVIGRRENYYRSSSSAFETALIMRRDAKLPAPVDLEKSCT